MEIHQLNPNDERATNNQENKNKIDPPKTKEDLNPTVPIISPPRLQPDIVANIERKFENVSSEIRKTISEKVDNLLAECYQDQTCIQLQFCLNIDGFEVISRERFDLLVDILKNKINPQKLYNDEIKNYNFSQEEAEKLIKVALVYPVVHNIAKGLARKIIYDGLNMKQATLVDGFEDICKCLRSKEDSLSIKGLDNSEVIKQALLMLRHKDGKPVYLDYQLEGMFDEFTQKKLKELGIITFEESYFQKIFRSSGNTSTFLVQGSQQDFGGAGLPNITGNACFSNASLQILYRFLLSNQQYRNIFIADISSEVKSDDSKQDVFYEALQVVFSKIHKRKNGQNEDIIKALKDLNSIIVKNNSEISFFRQSDAQEYLIALLDRLNYSQHSRCSWCTRIVPTSGVFTDRAFLTQVLDPLPSMAIDQPVNSLQTAFYQHMSSETLTKDTAYVDDTGNKVDAEKSTLLTQVEENMLVSLKRFSFVFQIGIKNPKLVEIPDFVCIPVFNDQGKVVGIAKMRVAGCVVHRGQYLNFGHYVYYERSYESQDEKSKWILINDNVEKEIPTQEAKGEMNKNGYIFHLKKVQEKQFAQPISLQEFIDAPPQLDSDNEDSKQNYEEIIDNWLQSYNQFKNEGEDLLALETVIKNIFEEAKRNESGVHLEELLIGILQRKTNPETGRNFTEAEIHSLRIEKMQADTKGKEDWGGNEDFEDDD